MRDTTEFSSISATTLSRPSVTQRYREIGTMNCPGTLDQYVLLSVLFEAAEDHRIKKIADRRDVAIAVDVFKEKPAGPGGGGVP